MKTHTGLKRILIFDDDADFRDLIVIYLGNMFKGVELVEYDVAAQGIPGQDFDWSRYDILLLDYRLRDPNVTGLDIIQANNRNAHFPATIMLTGTGSEELAVRALKAGVYDYLRKEQMGKQKLKSSILDAFEKHKSKQDGLRNQTQVGNKALFYQQLEQANSDSEKRILLLLELDNHTALEESLGIIQHDNIVQHIAKKSLEIFQKGQYHPSATRFSDASVALLIDDPGSEKVLGSRLEELCEHLEKTPYTFNDKEYSFTVSIGALALAAAQGTVEEIIQQVRRACKNASEAKENKVSAHCETDDPAGPAQQAAAASRATPAQTEVPAPKKAPPPLQRTATKKPAPKPKPKPAQKKQAQATAAKRHETLLDSRRPKPTNPGNGAAGQREASLKIKQAFDEERVMPIFQPVIPLSDAVAEDDHEIHSVSLQLLGAGGQVMEAKDIYAQTDTAFRKYVDRWIIREAIRRIVNHRMKYAFIIKLSQESLDDASLFNWLRKLLAGLEEKEPGKSITLEIKAPVFVNKEKQTGALISYLTRAHGFRFALSEFAKYSDVTGLTGKAGFTLARVDHKQIRQMAREYDKKSKTSALQQLKDLGVGLIADKVEDATTLTDIISIGADYAMGDFIGEPSQQLGQLTNVESLEVV